MKCKAYLSGITALLLLRLLAGPAIAATEPKGGKVYTLQESIREALVNNKYLKAKKQRIIQAVNVKNQARAELLPKVTTTYDYNRQSEARRFRSSLGGQIAVSSQDNYEWRGIITQPIFTGFALISAFRLAKLGIDQSEMEVELEKLDLALRVKKAYFNILITNKAVEVAKKDVESRESNLKMTRDFYEVGTIPVNDLLKTEVELANSRQWLVTARNSMRLARSAFNNLLSKPINADMTVEDILVYKSEEINFNKYVELAFSHRPEIKLVDINIQQADQEISLSKSGFYPEVALTYSYIKAGDKPDVSGSPFHDAGRWEVMTTLSWTHWEWGRSYYAIKEKEGLKEELIQTKLALKDDIRLQTKKAVLALKNAAENIPTTRKAVEQGKENLRVNMERYKAQMNTVTEILDAETLLTRARVNYYKALYNHNIAKAQLERAIGMY
jgi:outer membrane protein